MVEDSVLQNCPSWN